ncbi:hypothetical protein FXO38_24430 [Capsicum annuum]|nr:hypothetical protein FXO38_24430 [Capsicum annuum]
MGVECEHLASMISFAVKVQSAGDIMTLTTAAATGMGSGNGGGSNGTSSGELIPKENFLGICSRKFLARGGELLMRTQMKFANLKDGFDHLNGQDVRVRVVSLGYESYQGLVWWAVFDHLVSDPRLRPGYDDWWEPIIRKGTTHKRISLLAMIGGMSQSDICIILDRGFVVLLKIGMGGISISVGLMQALAVALVLGLTILLVVSSYYVLGLIVICFDILSGLVCCAEEVGVAAGLQRLRVVAGTGFGLVVGDGVLAVMERAFIFVGWLAMAAGGDWRGKEGGRL